MSMENRMENRLYATRISENIEKRKPRMFDHFTHLQTKKELSVRGSVFYRDTSLMLYCE